MKIRRLLNLFLLFLGVSLAGCNSAVAEPTLPPASLPDNEERIPQETVSLDEIEIVTGQTLYVPAYSEIFFFDEERTSNFAVTLAIHNTDLEQPIIITAIRYYDTDGQLVQEYIDSPRKLGPLAKTGVVISQEDTRGGVGANFIVEWVAETPVNEPAVETLMISKTGTHGLSLISPGRVLSRRP